MECYFGSFDRDYQGEDDHKKLVCFAIPEAGISFKAPFAGGNLHTEYASLLTLLEFVEMNTKIFDGKDLKLFNNNLDLISQVNQKAACMFEYSELLSKALEYKSKYSFTLNWVPREDNPAVRSLFD